MAEATYFDLACDAADFYGGPLPEADTYQLATGGKLVPRVRVSVSIPGKDRVTAEGADVQQACCTLLTEHFAEFLAIRRPPEEATT